MRSFAAPVLSTCRDGSRQNGATTLSHLLDSKESQAFILIPERGMKAAKSLLPRNALNTIHLYQ
jgi:hypothetical protein